MPAVSGGASPPVPSVPPTGLVNPLGLIVPAPQPPAAPPAPEPLTDQSDSASSPAHAVPLLFRLPSLGMSAAVLAVGTNARGQMDAPKGPASDPVWREAFWYRYGAVPGAPGRATIAGHVDDSLGRPAAFAHLRELQAGDPVEVVDLRTRRTMHFHITETRVYGLAEANSPAVRGRTFGSPATSGPALLSLITCAGEWQNGTYNKRMVAYAIRDDQANGAAPAPKPLLSL